MLLEVFMYKKTLLVVGILATFSTSAEVVYYDLPSKGVIAPQEYINQTSSVKVGLSAGLDRKTELVLKSKGDNPAEIFRKTSNYITVNDRIESSVGSDFYGVEFELPSLTDQQSYELTQNVYDIDGKLIKSKSVSLTVDTIGVQLEGMRTLYGSSSYDPSSKLHNGIMVTSQRNTSQFDSKFSFSLSEVKSATFTTYIENLKTGGWDQYKTKEAINSDGLMILRTSTSEVYRVKSYFPSYSSKVKVKLDVVDEAGNKTSASKEYQWVTCNVDESFLNADLNSIFKPFGITDSTSEGIPGVPNSIGFRAFEKGDVIPENPAEVIVRIPIEYSRYGNPYAGLSTSSINFNNEKQPLSVDDKYAYYTTTKGSIDATGTIYGRRLFTSQMCTAGINVGTNFTDDSKPPQIEDAIALIDKKEKYSLYAGLTKEISNRQKMLPSGKYSSATIGEWIGWKELTSIEVKVAPRSYAQTINTAYKRSKNCVVPANETSCTIDYNLPFKDIDGLIIQTEGGIVAYKEGTSLHGSKTEIRRIDFTPPTIEDAELDTSGKNFTGKLFHKRSGEQAHGYFYPSAVYGKATNKVTGEETMIKADLSITNSFFGEFKGGFDDLIDGDYSLEVVGYDAGGNSVTKQLGSMLVDNSAPVIDLISESEDVEDNDTVLGLESLTVKLTDKSPSIITSIVMNGGPASDDVQLDWVAVNDMEFTLEYPRLFPSLEEGDSYSITISAEDSYGNKSSKSIIIKYVPANIVTLKDGRYLTANKLLLDRGDQPLYQIITSELRGNDGQLLSGSTPVSFMLRSDSDFSVNVLGQIVHPGEIYEWNYQLGNRGGRISVPVFPGDDNKEGEANFLFEIMNVTTAN